MRKRILVTGGAGFLGAHLCQKLIDLGNDVICLDNYFTGSKKNIRHLLQNPYFEAIRKDVIHPFIYEVDQIYNLACPASPIHYQYNAVKTIKICVMGMINTLNLAKAVNATVLQTSTSEVYGDPKVHPQSESYFGHVNPIGVRSCYDEGKRCAESLCINYNRQYNVPVKIARIFNTYGPKMHPNDGRVVSNMILQALQNKPITIFGDGSQTRSFCFAQDMIDGLIALMNTPPSFIGPINLGNPQEITILELATQITKLTNSNSKIKFLKRQPDDPKKRNPNISLAKKQLKWAPIVPLQEGLKRTIEYFNVLLSERDLWKR